jgi:chaperonin cofactor prefoldin
MTVLVDSLKKQNEFLKAEIERFAQAIDNLAAQLVQTRAELKAKQEAEIGPETVSDGQVIINPPIVEDA